ncbi:restriction endonuclease subunit S [Desulfomicrobium escambiense]|uniref:restriction endonuclease subunit S n=1 Tax=Desulfomicrobium escambiense TaxID=29503 RepID=UPI0012EB0F22|nr:restriction endonuclease subunit S [Desulfomicrobium escambiense]
MKYPSYPEYKDSRVPWLGQVPSHWEVKKLGYMAAKIGSGKTPTGGATTYVDEGVLFLRSQNIYDSGLKLEDVVYIENDVDAEMANTRVIENDILLNITGASIGRSCIVPKKLPRANVNQHVCIIRQNKNCHSVFVSWVMKSICIKYQIQNAQNGAARDGLNFDQVGNLLIPLPPLEEENIIVDFLERETERIDTLLEKKRRLIALLKEKRIAIISRTVTRGLPEDVAREFGLEPHRRFKDSGVEWLGDVPDGWKVCKLKTITESRCDGPFGSGLKSEHYTDEGVRVVRLQNIRFAQFDNRVAAYIDREYYQGLGDHSVIPGDVLIAGLGDENNPVGRSCCAPDNLGDAMVKADCFRFRLHRKNAYSPFIALQLSVTANVLAGALSTGTTRGRMNLQVTANREIGLPPFIEQTAIAIYLDRETAKIDRLVEKVEAAIERLQELRSALITAAVTGKIDVRSAFPQKDVA